MTDLTSERLYELERELDAMDVARVDIDWPKHTRRTLVAMAKAKQAAERERDALRDVLLDCKNLVTGIIEESDGAACDWDYEVLGRSIGQDCAEFLPKLRAALAQPTTEGGE